MRRAAWLMVRSRTLAAWLPQDQKKGGSVMADKLAGLARHTVIVADTGDIAQIKAVRAQDCTTNPSLILKAASKPEYGALMDDAVAYAVAHERDSAARLELALDKLAVNFGTELSRIVPGYVSTEVDARLSFDTARTVQRAERMIALYREAGVDPARILIKIAATWEGVKAAAILKDKGIACNLTLIFAKVQAALCGAAGVFLISPFVGRITDWYKAHGAVVTSSEDDPGVRSVREIYEYFQAFGYKTVVMGASFRNTDQILGLAGCDRLTISPNLLEDLRGMTGEVERRLGGVSPRTDIAPLALDEIAFRWQLNEDAMATEKLSEGIRQFAKDTETLCNLLRAKLPA
jgi:transaldolase